jgi:hypothetical protein
MNLQTVLRPGHPSFEDLPWHLPLPRWQGNCSRLEELPIGVSRHPVAFINYGGSLYALKELPPALAEKEYGLLLEMEELSLPAVKPIGYTKIDHPTGPAGVLITRFLDHSIPYRQLFMGSRLVRYRGHLLDAIAGLLVQLHMAGVYWGDCSLSNILYRRDAGALTAYLVDAETAQIHPDRLPPVLRHNDLDIMEENVDGDLADLISLNFLSEGIPIDDTAAYIRQRYRRLWDEINHEDLIPANENFRIQERIRALNNLGFSVGDIELIDAPGGSSLRLRVAVTDRGFHRNQLFDMTGVEAEEMQARKMMNEIQEVKATLAQTENRSISLSAAAYYWLETYYRPTLERLTPLEHADMQSTELYCQVLEHKWYLSEQAKRDVGHSAATKDYISNIHE